jgi:hypothetical protein
MEGARTMTDYDYTIGIPPEEFDPRFDLPESQTITVTIHIDPDAQRAVIERLHPDCPYTIDEVLTFLTKMAIEEKAGSVLVDPDWRLGEQT